MTKNKTSENDNSVAEFINTYVTEEWKKEESFHLIELMKKWSGFEARMWGPSIIGFGSYHYVYKSGHEGNAALIGFSPRKAAFSLYVYSNTEESNKLLESLGKFTMGKACIYVKRLSDVDLLTLERLSMNTIDYLNEHYECACRK